MPTSSPISSRRSRAAASTPTAWGSERGLGRGAFDTNQMPLLRQLIDERFSATGYGLLDLVSTTADGIMVYIGGALMEAHVDLARIFQWACVGLFIAGLLLFVIPIPRRGRRSDSAPAQIAPTQSRSPGSIPVSCWTIARSAITARTG